MNIGISIPSLPKPTPAQIEAGNYKKFHLRWNGLEISIENPKNSIRSGIDKDGHRWQSRMTAHYGYFRGDYLSKDREPMDVFVGSDLESEKVFIVNQVIPGTSTLDEHKVIIGVHSEKEASDLYLSNYQKGWTGLGSIKAKTVDEFKEWLNEANLKVAAKGLITEKDAEDALIRHNKKKPEAKERHKFKPAEWTHPNGHPRCLICGDEPSMSGYCNDITDTPEGRKKFNLDPLGKAFSNIVNYFFGKAIRDLPLQPSHRNPMVRRHQKIGVAVPARRLPQRQRAEGRPPDYVRYSVFGQEVDQAELDSLLTEKYAVSSRDILRAFSLSVGEFYVRELRIDLDTGVDSDREGVEIKGFIYSGNSKAGMFTRTLKLADGVVTHNALSIDDQALQGQGFGVNFMKQQLDGYRRLGLSKIETWSDGEVGKYAWAMKGFDFEDEDTRHRVVGAFAKYLMAQRPKDYITRVRELNAIEHPWDIALFEIGGQRVGKEFLLSKEAPDYSAVFDTDSGSINSRIFDAYHQASTGKHEPRQQELSRRAV